MTSSGIRKLAVDAGDDDVEAVEEVVVLIEGAVAEDVDLDAGEERNGASSSSSRSTSSSCAAAGRW